MICSFARCSAVVVFALAVSACTEPSVPTAPTITTFQPILQPILNPPVTVEGLYQGTLLFTGATGGTGALREAGELECAGNAFNRAFANGNTSNDASMAITQDKTTNTNVTVKLISEETGLSCKYTGVIGAANGLISDAGPQDCTGISLLIRCQPDPVTGFIPVRELRLVGSSLSATFDGWPASVTGVTGRTAQTFNVFRLDNELEGGNSIGGLVVTHSLFMNRR